jgi:LmbE family N-acetylglucosaminyl deacetylase
MITCGFGGVQRVLCLGAHSDDIEIGCGGAVLELLRRQPGLEFLWFVASADAERRREAERSAGEFLRGAERADLRFGGFRESYFPEQWGSVKQAVEELKARFNPDLIFSHSREDRHQDHRTISDLTWNTFRNHLILEYEIPKYDGDLGRPNLFVPLEPEICEAKIGAVCRNFASQASKHWFTPDTFRSILRIRGIECASPYAEAFYCRKIVFS